MADSKKKESSPAVPEKEPIQTPETRAEAEGKTAEASTTRTESTTGSTAASTAASTTESTTELTTELTAEPDSVSAALKELEALKELRAPANVYMAPDNGPGRIRLDDMRAKASYSEALGASPKKESSSKSKFSEKDLVAFDKDAGKMDLDSLDLEAADAAMSGLSSMEMFDASAYPQPPARKSSLAPTAEEAEPGDDARSSSKPTRSRSQDNYDKSSFSRRKEDMVEENTRLRRHVQDLYKKINTLAAEKQGHINKLTTAKEIAEEKAERAQERIAEMKHHLNSDMSEIEINTEALARERDKLRDENRALREQLNDAQSHIFSLQPYRKDLTPEEVGREYDNLVESVQDWVQKFMDPWLDDHEEGVEGVLAIARKRPSDASKFRRALHQYPDLVHGSMFPETDEDILASIIMRYLHDAIFQSVLYGSIHNYTEIVSFIENQMQMSVEPKRDLFSVRTWTAEAYNALLSAPPFRSVRDRRRKDMTVELASLLKIFCKKDKLTAFCEGLDEKCIWPAMKLYEKLQVSTHHFYLDINPYIVWGSGGDLNTSPEFMDSLKSLDCRNILQNRKAFSISKIDPPPAKKELYHHLLNVCTVIPALYMRQIGQKDAIKEPMVVRRQQMLVAWGSEEKRKKFVEKGDRPIVSHLYHHSKERSGEAWTPFRWA